jgi:hypothetical protein
MRVQVFTGRVERQANLFGDNAAPACPDSKPVKQQCRHVVMMDVNDEFG